MAVFLFLCLVLLLGLTQNQPQLYQNVRDSESLLVEILVRKKGGKKNEGKGSNVVEIN